LPPKTRFPENAGMLLISQFEGKECRAEIANPFSWILMPSPVTKVA